MKTTTISYDEFTAPDYEDVATYYIKTALGDFMYIHTKSRKAAQEFVDSEYGKGKYTVRASKMTQPKEPINLGHPISAR